MYVELAGLPGSGKTFYRKRMSRALHLSDKYDAIAAHPLSTIVNRRLRLLLLFHRYIGKPARLYDSWQYLVLKQRPDYQKRLSVLTKAFAEWVTAGASDIQQLPLIHASLQRDLIFAWSAKDFGIRVVNDDGVVQRLFSLFGFRENDYQNEAAVNLSNVLLSCLPSDAKLIFLRRNPDRAYLNSIRRPSGAPELVRENYDSRYVRAAEYAVFLEGLVRSSGVAHIVLDGEDYNSDLREIARWIG